jgi:hypothetical protein
MPYYVSIHLDRVQSAVAPKTFVYSHVLATLIKFYVAKSMHYWKYVDTEPWIMTTAFESSHCVKKLIAPSESGKPFGELDLQLPCPVRLLVPVL